MSAAGVSEQRRFGGVPGHRGRRKATTPERERGRAEIADPDERPASCRRDRPCPACYPDGAPPGRQPETMALQRRLARRDPARAETLAPNRSFTPVATAETSDPTSSGTTCDQLAILHAAGRCSRARAASRSPPRPGESHRSGAPRVHRRCRVLPDSRLKDATSSFGADGTSTSLTRSSRAPTSSSSPRSARREIAASVKLSPRSASPSATTMTARRSRADAARGPVTTTQCQRQPPPRPARRSDRALPDAANRPRNDCLRTGRRGRRRALRPVKPADAFLAEAAVHADQRIGLTIGIGRRSHGADVSGRSGACARRVKLAVHVNSTPDSPKSSRTAARSWPGNIRPCRPRGRCAGCRHARAGLASCHTECGTGHESDRPCTGCIG